MGITNEFDLVCMMGQSERRCCPLIEHSYDMISLVSAEGNVLYTSPTVERILGFSREEIERKSVFEFVHPDDVEESIAVLQKVNETPGVPILHALRIIPKSGGYIFAEGAITNMLGVPGVRAIVSNFRDMTQHFRAEEALRQSEGRFRALIEKSTDGIALLSAGGEFTFGSPAGGHILGYELEEMIGRKAFEFVHPDDLEQMAEMWQNLLAMPGGSQVLELRCRHKNGSWVWIENTRTNLLDLPSVGAIVANFHDITERKQIEQKLKESEAHLLASQRIAHIGSWELDLTILNDLNQNPLRWSDECYRIFGFEPGQVEVTNELFFSAIPVGEHPLIQAAMRRALKTGEMYNIEHRVVRPDGTVHFVHERSDIIHDPETGKPLKMIGTVQDITERRQVEKQLQETEQNLRQIIDLIPYSIFCKNKEGRVLFGNLRHAELAGTTPEELMNKHQYEWNLRDEADAFLKDDLEVINSGVPKFIPEEPFTDIHGAKHILQTTKVPFVQAGANETAVLGISIEITEIKQAQELLQNQYALLKGLVESSDAPIYSVDAGYRYTSFNSAHAASVKLLYNEDIEIGEIMLDYVKDEVAAARVKQSNDRALGGELVAEEAWSEETDHGKRWFEVSRQPLRNGKNEIIGVSVFYNDITERKQADEEIRRVNASLEQRVAERTAELESFSYTVSHDLRSPLRSIDGFSSLLLRKYGDKLDADAQEYLHLMRGASQNMGQIIEGLLSLSRMSRNEMKQEQVDLSQAASSIASALQKTQPGREVAFVIEPEVVVHADANLMHVLLENLLGNAWKYTGKQPRARIEFGAMRENGHPVYFIKDDGAGFDMADAGKLFTSFQRLHTSSEFEGIGIGLATVQRIVQRHGGSVWAEGAVGQGATFYFTLLT